MKININTKHHNYDVIIQPGILNDISSNMNLNRKVLIITDTGIPQSLINTVSNQLMQSYLFTLNHGEKAKSINNCNKIIRYMTENKFERSDLIIALGGGVVGDISLFVASIYKRGMETLYIPTTTLAMCDSSIGGKCGINFNGIKNIIGTFHHPNLVLIDTRVLTTLPKRHLVNGLYEAIKIGLIYNKHLFNLFLEDDYLKKIDEIIYLSLLGKKYFVENDEYEQSIRKALNFGHTIGHALESYFDFKKLLHGEAVAIGMYYFSSDEVKAKLNLVYDKLKFKYKQKIDISDLLPFIYNDKKVKNSKISIIKVQTIGSYQIDEVSLDSLKAIFEVK